MSQLFSQPHHTAYLLQRMQAKGITSQRKLAQTIGISRWQLRQLLAGRVLQMRGEVLLKLSLTLEIPVAELLQRFSSLPIEALSIPADPDWAVATLQREYDRLQQDLQHQQNILEQQFQQSVLQTLESLLVNLPTAIYAVQQNPELPASRLVPLLKPIEQLLQQWGIEAINTVGQIVPYDPQWHEILEGIAQPGQIVKVRYVGYRQGDRLLHRAKVSPV